MAQITEKTSDKKQSELKKWREAAAALMRPSAAAARSMTTVENTAKGAASAMQAAAAAAAKTATATAKAAKAAARYTASFDEIEKLPAAPQAEEAGTSAKSSSSKSSSSRSSGSKSDSDWEKLKKAAAAFWDWLQELAGKGQEIWTKVWGALSKVALTVWNGLSTALSGLWQGTLSPFLDWMSGTFAPGIFGSLSAAMGPVASGVLTTGANALATAFQTGCGLASDAVQTVLLPAMGLVLQVWNGLMEGISTAWQSWGQPILTGMSLAVQNLMTLITSLWQTVVQPVLTQFIALAESLWTEHLQPLWARALNLLGAGQTMLLNFWNNLLMPLLNWMTQTFGPLIAQLLTVMGQTGTSAAAVLSEAANLIITAFAGVAQFMSNVFAGDWAAAWESVRATAAQVWAGIQNLVRTAVNGVIGLVNGMLNAVAAGINGVAGAINSLSFTVPDWVPGLGGQRFGFSIPAVTVPQIPMLASGGVIRQPTLAMMGEYPGASSDPEIAAPQSAMAQAMSDANGEVVDAVLTAAQQIIEAIRENGGGVVIGDEVIGRAVRRYNSRRAVITGGVA